MKENWHPGCKKDDKIFEDEPWRRQDFSDMNRKQQNTEIYKVSFKWLQYISPNPDYHPAEKRLLQNNKEVFLDAE